MLTPQVPLAAGMVAWQLHTEINAKFKTSTKVMVNSRPRLYIAGEGACSTTY